MRKFFFDDVRKAPDSAWVVARDVPEACAVLLTQTFDVMSLDHDIGFQMSCDECYEVYRGTCKSYEELEQKLMDLCTHHETGTHLARWMAVNIKKWPQLIIIHSANPYGAVRMAGILSPFTDVKIIRYDLCKYETLKNGKWRK